MSNIDNYRKMIDLSDQYVGADCEYPIAAAEWAAGTRNLSILDGLHICVGAAIRGQYGYAGLIAEARKVCPKSDAAKAWVAEVLAEAEAHKADAEADGVGRFF